MGDSITAGQYVDPERRWTSLVGDALLRRYLHTPINLHFINRGVSGETTRQGLERFPADVQQHRPEIVTLQFGLNDCNCWVTDAGLPRVSEAAYRANLIEMIKRAQRFGAHQIILSTNHPTLRHKILMSGDSLETRRRRYNDHVREVASLAGVELCDIEAGFAHLDGRELAAMVLPYPDQLHLSGEGHRLYASCIQPFVERATAELVSHD
jgi:lysophospholipase L1-like esterase